MGMKNDISFLLDGRMGLFEHQSTLDPNMPLRGLFYFSDLYKQFFYDRVIYSTRLLQIPAPVYVIFYNGEREAADTSVLKLSDAFIQGEDMACLEVCARMVNINVGHNAELMKRCGLLREYAVFISYVRGNLLIMEPETAIFAAMDQCIADGILAEFLSKRRAEAMNALLTEYDEEKVMRSLSREYYEDGYDAGRKEGRAEAVLELLEELGEVSADLRERIISEEDLMLLKQWHKEAARAESIQMFLARTRLI